MKVAVHMCCAKREVEFDLVDGVIICPGSIE